MQMKIDRGLLGTLALAALSAACASAATGTGAGGGGGTRFVVPVPEVACASGPLTSTAGADSAAGLLALAGASSSDSVQAVSFANARATAGRAIAGAPQNAYAYFVAGQAALSTRDVSDADSLLRRAVELCPELAANEDYLRFSRYGGALAFERAASLVQAGDTASGVAAYQSSLRLDPNNYPAAFYLGLTSYARRETDEAVRHWRHTAEIIDRLPADSSAQVNAERASARANAVNALSFAARQYIERENAPAAAALLTQLVRDLPNNADVWYTYALTLNTQQRWRELLPAAQRAVELAPLSYGSLVLYYNAYAGQSQEAAAANQNTQAAELGRLAAEVRRRHEGLPVQIEGVQVDVEGGTTTVRGTAVGTGPRAPVTLEFTLHGVNGPVGTGTTTVTPPAQDQQEQFELTIQNSAPVLGVSYRVVGG
jgi:tetratricopeptide (TPR) repeat protein